MPLYWVLDHKYTEVNLSLRGLKTIDQTRMQCLQMICSELDFDLFLTTLEKMETGQVTDYDSSEDERNEGGHHSISDTSDLCYTAKSIFDLVGNKVVSEIEFDGKDIIQEEPFGDKPDKEDYEGYMVCLISQSQLSIPTFSPRFLGFVLICMNGVSAHFSGKANVEYGRATRSVILLLVHTRH